MDFETLERALRDDYERTCRAAVVPDAGAVLWRAGIRARADAARKADRPLTIATGLAAATIVGAGTAMIGTAWGTLPHLSRWTFFTGSPALTLALCGAALALISPLALVALGSRKRCGRQQD